MTSPRLRPTELLMTLTKKDSGACSVSAAAASTRLCSSGGGAAVVGVRCSLTPELLP